MNDDDDAYTAQEQADDGDSDWETEEEEEVEQATADDEEDGEDVPAGGEDGPGLCTQFKRMDVPDGGIQILLAL